MASINPNFDFYGRYQYPDLQLCNPNKNVICNLTNIKGLSFTLRCNDVSEMKFNVYKYMNNIEFDYYSYIRKMRLVHVDGMGYFVIQEINEVRSDMVPYKEVLCYSAEYILNYKPVNLAYVTMVEGGTQVYAKSYKFYDAEYPSDTLMYRLFAGSDFDDWSFDYINIDESLCEKYRSFDDTGDGLYGFLQNSVSTAYDCIFTYDIENYVVSVHKKDELIKQTDIIISFDNLMKESQLSELSDDIVTILSVSGSDSFGLSKINPTGNNNIYKFDYYLSEDWIGKSFDVEGIKYDSDGNMVMSGTRPATTIMPFEEHVITWQNQIKKLIQSSKDEGSYAWLLKRQAYLNSQYQIVNVFYTYSDYIYNYCTEALTTYIEETNEVKKSSWTSIVVGLGLVAAVVGCVALAAFSGGIALPALGTAMASGGIAVAESLGLSGTAAVVAGTIGSTTVASGISMAFEGMLQLGSAVYQSNVTKEQMQKYQKIAQKNIEVCKSGGDYVYNLTTETITNILGGKYNEYVADEKLYWVSKTYDESDEASIYQKVPNDQDVDLNVTQIYCLDVLTNKLEYIKSKIQWYVDIYSYNNWFSEKERKVLQPFLIQSEYADDSFIATDDIDIDTETDMSKNVTTNQGTMTLEEYKSAINGYYIKYFCVGDGINPSIDYEATPIKFNVKTFRSWLVMQNNYTQYKGKEDELSGHFYIYYDSVYWTISSVDNSAEDNDSGEVINQIRGTFPTPLGITQDTHDGKYKYTPKSGDYILLNLYSGQLEIIDTTTVALQLAEQAYSVLDECSQPSFSFNISCNNFLLLEEYKDWIQQIGFDGSGITLGTMITVPYESGIVFTPFVQEVSFEYDNPDSLNLTFGNKFNLGTSEYTIGKILSNNTSNAQKSTRGITAVMSNTQRTWNSGNTISSIDNNINSSIGKFDPILGDISDSLEQQKNDLENLNGELDNWLDEYETDKEDINNKFDIINDNFNNYPNTQQVTNLIDTSKQQTLEQAAIEAQKKVDDNNSGFIAGIVSQITGQQDADREAAQKAAQEAYDNAIAETNRFVEEYYSNMKITYDKLDQQIKDILGEASEALNKANAIIEESMKNWDYAGSLVAGGMGLYSTKIPSGANGGVKLAFHDKPNLEDSKIIWYVTSNGIVWTANANGVTINNIDEQAKYWSSAISATESGGSMVINNIKAHKITGELITANTITSKNIVAGSIVGESLAVSTITGDKIVAQSIYAQNLAKDAVFALCWVGADVSMGSATLYGNQTVRSPSGVIKTADFSDYTGIMIFSIFSTSTIGGSSAVAVQGKRTSIWEPVSTTSITSWATYSWESTGYRDILLNGSVVNVGEAKLLDWQDWKTSGAYTIFGAVGVYLTNGFHHHFTGGGTKFSPAETENEKKLAVPKYIYGFVLGV